MAKSTNNSKNKLTIPVSFETKPEEEIPLQAFLFTRTGKLIEKTAVQNNSVEFNIGNVNPKELRVLIAPSADKRIDQVSTMTELKKFKPYEALINYDAKGNIKVLPIPSYLIKLWNLRICRVRGRVIKNFSIGIINQDRGLCHARVHICEVDRLWLWINKIPDDIIKKIPEIVDGPQWPIPIPDPGPEIITALNPQPLPPKVVTANVLTKAITNINPISETTKLSSTSAAASISVKESTAAINVKTSDQGVSNLSAIQLPPAIKTQLLSGNVTAIRKTIVDNFQLFHPWFCYIPWLWPYFYHCDEIKVVYTDLNGHFDTNYWYWWDGDKPDLYFWVEYLIEGVWTTVYKPSIPCNTYWDYVCGSDITIRVTDPRVRWECNNVVEGDIVWIKTIGNSASVVHIRQTDLNTVVQGKNFNRIGLSDVSVWASPNTVGDYRRPFGSTLGFIIQFGSSLPSNGMYYYRWSYRKIRNADLSAVALTTPQSLHSGQALYKSYTYEFYDIFMHKHIGSKSFQLGPVSKNGNDDLFIIPPAYPSAAPVNAAETSPLWDQNTLSVSFDSAKFSDGLYEFFLELFDFAGNKLTTIPKQLFQVPDFNTFSPSVDAPNQNLVLNGAANASAFKMVARIDNSACEADIFKIKVNGSEVTTDCCGFVPYPPNANIEVSYRAYHPQNFATFGFTVQKGTCNDATQTALTNASGMVIGDAGVYARDSSSIYRHTFTPAQLLGICSTDGKAAFAELLNLHALATNGSNQLNFLNDSALAAFALEPA
jgi:hypothetical protein